MTLAEFELGGGGSTGILSRAYLSILIFRDCHNILRAAQAILSCPIFRWTDINQQMSAADDEGISVDPRRALGRRPGEQPSRVSTMSAA